MGAAAVRFKIDRALNSKTEFQYRGRGRARSSQGFAPRLNGMAMSAVAAIRGASRRD
jgi:hypothetical protein